MSHFPTTSKSLSSILVKHKPRQENSLLFPAIRISLRKKSKPAKIIEKFKPCFIRLDDTISPSTRPHFTTPKKIRKIIKRPEYSVGESRCSPKSIDEISVFPINYEQRAKKKSLEKLTAVVSTHKDVEQIDNNIESEMNNNESLRRMKTTEMILASREKSFNSKVTKSIYPLGYFDRISREYENKTPTRIKSLLVLKSPPSKSPTYIKHSSYKAGYFLSKIGQALNRLQTPLSRSLVATGYIKNTLKMLALTGSKLNNK